MDMELVEEVTIKEDNEEREEEDDVVEKEDVLEEVEMLEEVGLELEDDDNGDVEERGYDLEETSMLKVFS